MRREFKLVLAGVLLGIIWGIILILPSILSLSECRGRDFFDIIQENFVYRVIERPVLGLLSILTAPVLISMAIVCSLPTGGYAGFAYLYSICLTMFFSILFSLIISLGLGCLRTRKHIVLSKFGAYNEKMG
jgi:hypothetical protein